MLLWECLTAVRSVLGWFWDLTQCPIGRLNVLANVVRKPLAAILNEFHKDKDQLDDMGEGSGDVKYHLGTSYDRPTVSGKKVHISLLANPSHLEAVRGTNHQHIQSGTDNNPR